ncbi:sensor histidine kinase [Aquimarina brevivitae]|uniref:histidine kinase n=1 Tax=Aquimarina brevivitae TaxID=323412 RepID=A0A4Q7NTY4_9FLAO|nr:PAS domain-containing sensor histidine kinase [Aquimarina brevivitae]RZS90636.1 PAS domain S-box-containing protein [Aquimarina brevivitae]
MATKNKNNTTTNAEIPKDWSDYQHIDLDGDIYKQIFNYSIIPTIVHDLQMNILNVNDSAVSAFGFSEEEFLEKSVFELHTEDEINHSNVILQKMKNKEQLSIETKFKRKDGSFFYAKATPRKYLVGNKPLIHVFIEDITERKIAAQQLQEYNQALEQQIAKVKSHAKQLEAKNKELKDFSYVAAHDLKAPITNISVLSEMLQLTEVKDEQDLEIFERLKKNINRLHNTIYTLNDVLNFKSTLKNKKETLNIKEVFDEVKKSIAEQIKAANASIEEDFEAIEQFTFSYIHLKSILQNLLTNALKYRDPERPLLITIKTTRENGQLCLSVKDNGLGFNSEKYEEKVFGLFKRLHTHVDGKGVGMYIVKSIVEANDGEIFVHSIPDKGTEFRIMLKI